MVILAKSVEMSVTIYLSTKRRVSQDLNVQERNIEVLLTSLIGQNVIS
jgi:hypothetical protein